VTGRTALTGAFEAPLRDTLARGAMCCRSRSPEAGEPLRRRKGAPAPVVTGAGEQKTPPGDRHSPRETGVAGAL